MTPRSHSRETSEFVLHQEPLVSSTFAPTDNATESDDPRDRPATLPSSGNSSASSTIDGSIDAVVWDPIDFEPQAIAVTEIHESEVEETSFVDGTNNSAANVPLWSIPQPASTAIDVSTADYAARTPTITLHNALQYLTSALLTDSDLSSLCNPSPADSQTYSGTLMVFLTHPHLSTVKAGMRTTAFIQLCGQRTSLTSAQHGEVYELCKFLSGSEVVELDGEETVDVCGGWEVRYRNEVGDVVRMGLKSELGYGSLWPFEVGKFGW